MRYHFVVFLAMALLSPLFLSCGVKGPPLPPLPVTPQQSDIERRQAPNAAASPTPSPEENQ